MRIVSLLPSATEIVAKLGRERDLVGRSAECDFPETVAALPVVMRARTQDGDRPSGEIDRRVRAEREGGASLYELDVELLRVLQPDVLLTQDLCGVCSVTGEEVTAACEKAGISPRIVSLTPKGLADVREDIRTVASAIGAQAAGESLDLELRARESAVVGRALRDRPMIAVIEWLDPPIVAGLWVPEMISLAGGTPAGGVSPREPGVRTSWSELRSSRPRIAIVSPCSFRVERSLSELADARIATGLQDLSAEEMWIVDEAYFSRPGPRLWDGLELLARLVDGEGGDGPMPTVRWTGPQLLVGAGA
jgi:iron complex transport system substrate-binding protein